MHGPLNVKLPEFNLMKLYSSSDLNIPGPTLISADVLVVLLCISHWFSSRSAINITKFCVW